MDTISLFIQLNSIIFGLVIGSFLSVCIYRIPLGRSIAIGPDEEEEVEPGLEALPSLPTQQFIDGKPVSILFPPRSFCPACRAQLPWFHNVPLFSWLLLRGRCGLCQAPISARYPIVELMSAFFCWLSFFHFGFTPTAFVIYGLCATLIVISFIDIDYFIIPNVITFPGIALGLATATANQFFSWFAYPCATGFVDGILGSLLGAGFLWLMAEGYFRIQGRVGMGLGDVKLLAFLGAFLGVWGSFYTIFIGSLVGSVVGIMMILVGGKKMSHHLPFGPYLAAGAILYMFSHTEWLRWIVALIVPLPIN
ncbi:MAG: prepilin peptidase [Bdellovibrionota bacterium]|nr:MAG: prepilin peptidase [Bdellovibrionota bacterium]